MPVTEAYKGLTVTVMVPVGVVPGGDVMVPLTVTGALAAGLVGVTVWLTDVTPEGGGDGVGDGEPPITVRAVTKLAVGDVAPAPNKVSSEHLTTSCGAIASAFQTAVFQSVALSV